MSIEHDRQYYRAEDYKEQAESAEQAIRALRDAATNLSRAADQVTSCFAEFGEQKIGGECLCTSCGERLGHLDTAREALEKALGAREDG